MNLCLTSKLLYHPPFDLTTLLLPPCLCYFPLLLPLHLQISTQQLLQPTQIHSFPNALAQDLWVVVYLKLTSPLSEDILSLCGVTNGDFGVIQLYIRVSDLKTNALGPAHHSCSLQSPVQPTLLDFLPLPWPSVLQKKRFLCCELFSRPADALAPQTAITYRIGKQRFLTLCVVFSVLFFSCLYKIVCCPRSLGTLLSWPVLAGM